VAKQELLSPRVPIVRTSKRAGELEILEEAFAVAPLVASTKSHNEFLIERGWHNDRRTALGASR